MTWLSGDRRGLRPNFRLFLKEPRTSVDYIGRRRRRTPLRAAAALYICSGAQPSGIVWVKGAGVVCVTRTQCTQRWMKKNQPPGNETAEIPAGNGGKRKTRGRKAFLQAAVSARSEYVAMRAAGEAGEFNPQASTLFMEQRNMVSFDFSKSQRDRLGMKHDKAP